MGQFRSPRRNPSWAFDSSRGPGQRPWLAAGFVFSERRVVDEALSIDLLKLLRRAGDRGGVVDHEVMAVVGGDDQRRVVPVAVGLDPFEDDADGVLAAVNGADGVVEVVVVEGEVDVAGLDEQGEGLAGPVREDGDRGAGQVDQPGRLQQVLGSISVGLAGDPGDGVVAAVGGPVREVVERGLAVEAEQAMVALRGPIGGLEEGGGPPGRPRPRPWRAPRARRRPTGGSRRRTCRRGGRRSP